MFQFVSDKKLTERSVSFYLTQKIISSIQVVKTPKRRPDQHREKVKFQPNKKKRGELLINCNLVRDLTIVSLQSHHLGREIENRKKKRENRFDWECLVFRDCFFLFLYLFRGIANDVITIPHIFFPLFSQFPCRIEETQNWNRLDSFHIIQILFSQANAKWEGKPK
jgi:hypothetical protein